MGGLRRIPNENLIEERELLFERVKNILSAGELPGLCEQFQALCGFPRTRRGEIPYRSFQSVRRPFQSCCVAGAQRLEYLPAF